MEKYALLATLKAKPGKEDALEKLLQSAEPLAKAEPATLRHRLLHTAVRLISHSRHLILRVCQTWPWAQEFADAFNRALAIP